MWQSCFKGKADLGQSTPLALPRCLASLSHAACAPFHW